LGQFRAATLTGELWLIGEGPIAYVSELRRLTNRLGISSFVKFLGRVGTTERNDRMSESFGLLMASVREGFGLVVAEAGACGTPAVVYDVPGLRDAVRHERSGLVVEPSPTAMAQAMITLFDNEPLYKQLRTGAIRASGKLSFDTSAHVLRTSVLSHMAMPQV
jgi:glycosyltransferase involved in cell wall biosynthesis